MQTVAEMVARRGDRPYASRQQWAGAYNAQQQVARGAVCVRFVPCARLRHSSARGDARPTVPAVVRQGRAQELPRVGSDLGFADLGQQGAAPPWTLRLS